tara:strand:- start:827 stop:2155 length:1329 start_codon:yes stop_codon:yes gene_type:complete
MSRKRAFNEVPFASRLDWLSSKEIARRLGVRTRQVDGWALHGYVRSCKHGRRRLICEADCRAWFENPDRSTRRFASNNRASSTERTAPPPAPAPEPLPIDEPPPIHCEVVPIQVNGTELAGIRLDGQEVIAAQLLEKILQLKPRSISARLSRGGRFVEGRDYVVLRGRAMGAVRDHAVDLGSTAPLQNVSQLTVLTETGVSQVLLTMRSPVTDVLAGMLYGSNFMRRAARAVMQGDQEGFARNAADDATDALARLRSFVETELSDLREDLAAALEENQDLRRQLDDNTEKIDMVDRRLVDMPDDVARSLAPIIAEVARKARGAGPAQQQDPFRPRPIRPNEDPFYHPRLTSTDVANKLKTILPRCEHSRISTSAVNAAGRKAAGKYWARRDVLFVGQDVPGFIEKGPSPYKGLRYWYSEAFVLKVLKYFRSGQTDLFDGDQA